ncbi:MAG: hypothetical protein DRJ96_07055, partial [Thermoprotei archaeon]
CSLITPTSLELPEPTGLVRVGAAEFEARVISMEVVEVSELRASLPRKFVLRFKTPTLLPVPGRGSLLREAGVKRRYRLVPDLPLALKLLAYDLRLQGIGLIRSSPRRIFAWAYRALAELDYRVRPVTVLYTVREGRPAVERGFVGYVAYELLDEKSDYAEDFYRLMGYALRFGIGKSRSIGFGYVEAAPLPDASSRES